MNQPQTQATENTVRQRYLGNRGLVALIALLSAFVPLSTDLYLPALPTMTTYFHTSQSYVNLTLILFFIFFGVGNLIWGPLSDKYGRKPILITGLTLYTAASLFCALSLNITMLIFFRVLQAVGGSAAGAVATAIVKDSYSGRRRVSVLALVQSMVVISPAVAPVLGAFLLSFVSWHGTFIALTVIGAISLLGSILFQESLQERNTGSVIRTIGRLGTVLKNPGFTSLLLIFSLMVISGMAFISSSSYIYQDGFKLSSQVYSYYFTFNALGMLAGPMLFVRLSRRVHYEKIITACFAVTALSGLLICFFGSLQPWLFALVLLPSTVASSCIRPASTNLMLEQQKGDTGSASSLMGAFGTLMGSVGMMLMSLNWASLLIAVGVLNVVIAVVCGSLWLALRHKPFIKPVDEVLHHRQPEAK